MEFLWRFHSQLHDFTNFYPSSTCTDGVVVVVAHENFHGFFFFVTCDFKSIYFFYDTKSWKESEFKDICKEWKFFSGWVCLKHTAIEFTTVCEMEKERGEIFDMPRDDDDDDEKFPSISPLFVLSDYEMNEWGKYVMLVILVYSVWNISE